MGDFIAGFWPFLLMIPIFYFLIYKPQAKKQKKQANFLDDLKKGDEVVTNSGIVGKISKIEDDNKSVKLQVDSKTFITVLKSAVSEEMTQSYRGANE